MTEIKYQLIAQYLKDRPGESFDPVYLVWGDEFLCRQAVKTLVNLMISDPEKQKHGYEIINQKQDGRIADVIEGLNTYSFFSKKKVIELRDTTVFVTRENYDKLILKAKKAYDNQDRDGAASYFLSLLSRLNLQPEDINQEIIADRFNVDRTDLPDFKWMLELSAYCRDNQLPLPDFISESELLKRAIEQGFPENNHLIISTDSVDRRLGLYKTIKKFGTVIDCSVAKGTRKAEKDQQRKILFQQIKQTLAKHQKEMDSQVFEFMYDMIGFDLHTFASSLEKLIDFVGDRPRISMADARRVLKRVREDPIYELTGAVCEKNIPHAMYYLSSLLSSGYHPLQLLTAIINQIRNLLLVKGYLKSPHARGWQRGLDYGRFKKDVMPAILKYDEDLLTHRRSHGYDVWGKSSAKPSTGLLIVKNPGNPYPAYQLFLRSDNFEEEELYLAFEALRNADLKLKTLGVNPKFVLEEVIFTICQQKQCKSPVESMNT